MREKFNRLEEGSEIFIEVDLNAYNNKNRWLFSVFVKYDSSSEENVGYEEFLESKESLIISLSHSYDAVYVGNRVVDGWSELYFYTNISKGLEKEVKKSFDGYMFESYVTKDSKWDFYRESLYPTNVELANIQSKSIIAELEDEGDDLEVEREVEYYISFETPTQKERFLAKLPFDGFVYKDEIESDECDNGIVLVKNHSINITLLQQNIASLFENIKEQNGVYEGWSTTFVPKGEDA